MGEDAEEVAREVEEIAVNAWPAALTQSLDGWELRFDHDGTWRACSVWPRREGGRRTLAEKLALAEDFYARRGLGARFQISSLARPAGLDAELAQRGYARHKPTRVEQAALPVLRASTRPVPGLRIERFEKHDARWFGAYARIHALAPAWLEARRTRLERIGPRRCHVLACWEGEPVAVGTGVCERGWLGLFSLATLAPWRRRGFSGALLQELAAWGAQHGAERAYLQVEEENQVARRIYAKLGFLALDAYHYRAAPPA